MADTPETEESVAVGTTALEVEPFAVPSTPVNDFLQIASGGGAIVESQPEWAAEGGILNNGFPTGIVLQEQYNKAWRQATAWIRPLGWHASQLLGQNTVDDGNAEKLWRQLYESFLVTHLFISGGTNNYTTTNPYGLSWTSPPRNGTQIVFWSSSANTSEVCTLNFMGSGVYPIRHHIDGTNPHIGDISGFIHLIYADGVWHITAVNRSMVKNIVNEISPKLQTDLIYYVNPSGNDTNDGLTPGTPLRTGQAAWNKAIIIDLNGHTLTIQFANGTYTDPMLCYGQVRGIINQGGILIQGNVASPNLVLFNVTNATSIHATSGAVIYVRGITVQATGLAADYQNRGYGLCASTGAVISFSHMIFGPCQTSHMCVYTATIVAAFAGATYTITGGGLMHLETHNGGVLATNAAVVTLTGTPNFSQAFAFSAGNAVIYAPNSTYIGAATGPRYLAIINGAIIVQPGGATYFPGSIAGTVTTGGQYY